jgi:hypothetical protein
VPKKSMSLSDVRAIALALPEAEEGTSYGTAAWRVKGKLFARALEDASSIVIKVDLDARDGLVAASPEAFVVTPHYQNYPMMVVKLGAVPRGLLHDLLIEAWRRTAPPKVVAAFDATAKPKKRPRSPRTRAGSR